MVQKEKKQVIKKEEQKPVTPSVVSNASTTIGAKSNVTKVAETRPAIQTGRI